MSNNDDWFAKYKDLERKILEKNKEIEVLEEKEKQLKQEIALEQQKQNEVKLSFTSKNLIDKIENNIEEIKILKSDLNGGLYQKREEKK